MELDDFSIMIKGYFDKRKRDELNFARVGFIIDGFASGLSGQKINPKKWFADWFGEKDQPVDKVGRKKKSEEIMKKVKLTNKILEEKKKNAKRVKNSN